MNKLKVLWCNLWHWGGKKKVIAFYSNNTHRYYCYKCNHEYDE